MEDGPGPETESPTEVFDLLEALGLAEDMAEGLQQEGDAPVVVKVTKVVEYPHEGICWLMHYEAAPICAGECPGCC